MKNDLFKREYERLNKEQKEAVDSIDHGPIMVIAGPGTGKTQILALRIGKILKEIGASEDSSILCLTFTNSGVLAMKNRLEKYFGKEANKVNVSTFHSFAFSLIEKYYDLLDFNIMPKILEDYEVVFLIDEILQEGDWKYLKPRGNPSLYFKDLKQLISILKREELSRENFLFHIEKDINFLKNDENSISTRGESKGKLKKEILKKIESLEKTKEFVSFYEIYENKKKELCLLDYDDVLEKLIYLVSNYENVRQEIYENYQYVLVDEHQDSSNVQNSFLKAVWKDQEKPNIFVVGDDRQLIYGFSGAKLSYFEEFSNFFGKAKIIILNQNYRSTSKILALADSLLKSKMTKEALKSNIKGEEKILLKEYSYPKDEIIGAYLYFKDKIEKGDKVEECALLLPKNSNVKDALSILKDLGLPTSSNKKNSLFDFKQSYDFINILKIIVNPYDSNLLSFSLLSNYSGINKMEAYKFLKNTDAKKISIEEIILAEEKNNLFANQNNISKWGNLLKKWVELGGDKISRIISIIGNELLINQSKSNEELIENVEIVRTLIHNALFFEKKHKNKKLVDFINYLERLEKYQSHIEVALFSNKKGVEVMTLHKSKGLEYKNVWIGHINEEVLTRGKNSNFTLPEEVKEHIKRKDMESTKRELYVAITRAKESCVISYAKNNYIGRELNILDILKELDDIHFIKKSKEENEKEILENKEAGIKIFSKIKEKEDKKTISEIKDFVKDNYKDIRISVSLLNNFFECPRKWYFRNFLKLPDVKGISLQIGSIVHSAIEFILSKDSLPKEKELNNFIDNEISKENIKDEKEIKNLKKIVENIISNFIKNYYNTISKNHKTELSINFKDKDFENILITGKLDLVEINKDNSIVITDFKTGKPKTKNEIEKCDDEGRLSSYLRQLAMYSYLIDKDYKYKKIESLKLLFLEGDVKDKNRVYSTYIDEEKIDLLKRDLRDYLKSLEDGSWIDKKCNIKYFGTNEKECIYCKMINSFK